MDISERGNYKITVNVPSEYLEDMMDRINEAIDPLYPGYDRTFTYSRVTGTWRPLPGSSPFKGIIGKIEVAEEMKLEFVVRGKDVKTVVSVINDIHPYEEPAIDIVPAICGKDVT
ncbi:MAG: hypothetical protein FWF40_03745 [Methanomassiliicoccaceae archaeon]|nr:hypothetical protein [Methanomassiliicoccaceae archaeon]